MDGRPLPVPKTFAAQVVAAQQQKHRTEARQAGPSECSQQGQNSDPYMCVAQPTHRAAPKKGVEIVQSGWLGGIRPAQNFTTAASASCAAHTTLHQEGGTSIRKQSQYHTDNHVCDRVIVLPINLCLSHCCSHPDEARWHCRGKQSAAAQPLPAAQNPPM